MFHVYSIRISKSLGCFCLSGPANIGSEVVQVQEMHEQKNHLQHDLKNSGYFEGYGITHS